MSAVPGMICIKPMAPAADKAQGLKADSCFMTDRSKSGLIPCLPAAACTNLFTSEVSSASQESVTTCTLGMARGREPGQGTVKKSEDLDVLTACEEAAVGGSSVCGEPMPSGSTCLTTESCC